MKEEWNILRLLRHSRHDWLNVVQLIKGNLALKKFDRIEEIIEEVIMQTKHESKLSNLDIPQFASELLVFNWENKSHFQLEFEVIGHTENLSTYDDGLLQLFLKISSILNEICKKYGENHLLVTIKLISEQSPRITFDFHGQLIDVSNFKKFIENKSNWNERLQLVESYLCKEEFYLMFDLS